MDNKIWVIGGAALVAALGGWFVFSGGEDGESPAAEQLQTEESADSEDDTDDGDGDDSDTEDDDTEDDDG